MNNSILVIHERGPQGKEAFSQRRAFDKSTGLKQPNGKISEK